MKRAASASLFLLLLITACTSSKQSSENRSEVKSEATPATQANAPGELQVGQAKGSCTARGETVELKYAYAGRAQRFGNEAMVILLTDNPIPADAVAEEIRSQTLLQKGEIRGLEYAVDKDGTWVRFHPSQYQESSNKQLKEYSVEGDVVRGLDDGSANLSDKYNRNVKFVAAIVK
ncbi:MAG TPA: hypothetical protein VI306_18530 [Pyrinomonadaceae bacterium]